MKRILIALALAGLAAPVAAQGPVYAPNGEQKNQCKVWDGAQTADVTAGLRLAVDGSGVTQPVSGTLTCNAGSGTMAVSGPLTDAQLRATPVPVSGTVTANAGSGTFTVSDGAGALNVIIDSGTTAATQSGTWTVQPGNTANTTPWLLAIDQTGNNNAVDVLTMPTTTVTGTVTANAGTGTFGVGDGSGPLTVDGTVTVTDGSGALNVIVDSSALPSGAATAANQDGIVRDGTGDTTQANVASGRLQVDASGTVTVTDGAGALNVIVDSGSITANAGTNLNTSALLTTSSFDAAFGTAGTADAQVMSVQGIASMTPLTVSATNLDVQIGGSDSLTIGTLPALVAGTANIGDVDVLTLPSVTIGTFPDNEPFNVAQINGVTPLMGNGASGTGAQRVTIANDSTGVLATVTTVGTVTNLTNLPNEGQQTAANSISTTIDTDNDFIAADGAAPPTGRAAIGGLTSGATGGLMETFTICDSFVNINVVTATTTLLVTGVSGRHVRLCSMNMVTAGSNNVALISGTGATCGTGTTGMTGGTTAATGYNFAAGGGIAQGSGFGEINRTNATGDSVCVITSAATQLSGRLAYAIY